MGNSPLEYLEKEEGYTEDVGLDIDSIVQSALEEELAMKGLNPDGTPIMQPMGTYGHPVLSSPRPNVRSVFEDPYTASFPEESAALETNMGMVPPLSREEALREERLSRMPSAGTMQNPYAIDDRGEFVSSQEANRALVKLPSQAREELGQEQRTSLQMPSTMKMRSGSTQTIPAALTPSQEVFRREDAAEILKASRGVKEGKVGLYGKMQEYLKKEKKVDTKKLSALEEERAYMDHKIEDLEAEIRDGVVHPFKKMPVVAQMASMIAISLGAAGEALTSGRVPNTALAMFNKAIDRDIAIQKVNLTKSMRLLNLNKKTMSQIKSQMERFENKQRQGAYKALELEVLKVGANTDLISAQKRALEMSLRIDQMSNEKKIKTTSYKTVPVSQVGTGPGKLKDLDPIARRAIDGAVTATEKMKELYNSIEEYKGKDKGVDISAWFAANTPFVKKYTKAGGIQTFADSLALEYAAAANQGRPTDKDFMALRPNIPGPDESIEMTKIKLKRLQKTMRNIIKNKIKSVPHDRYDVRAAQDLLRHFDQIKFE